MELAPARPHFARREIARLAVMLTVLALPARATGGGAAQPFQDPRLRRPDLSDFELIEAGNGFGQLLPYRVFKLSANGDPSSLLINIRSVSDLVSNVRPNNPVLPVQPWPSVAVLPNGLPGNHYVFVRFNQPPDIASILDPSPHGAGTPHLTNNLSVSAIDPVTGSISPIAGRAFLGGQTYAGVPQGDPHRFRLQTWFQIVNGRVVALPDVDNDHNGVPDGLGFPGTEPGTSFQGSADLLDPSVFVFVPDSDDDLATHETFPIGKQITLTLLPSIRGKSGDRLFHQARAGATVGADVLAPEVQIDAPPSAAPLITPPPGASNVDPLTQIRVQFTEALQPLSVGSLPSEHIPLVSSAISISFGPLAYRTQVAFTAEPASPFDFHQWKLTPSFAFPGESAVPPDCGVFNQVLIDVHAGGVRDLTNHVNAVPAASVFTTGEGPGLANAPVTPDAIYVASAGANPSIGVIDLNGFGASTGYPGFDPTLLTISEGQSIYPFNPNVRLQGALLKPALQPGTCTVDGGASGVFRFTRGSDLSPALARDPTIATVTDMMLGHALDTTFNNGPSPFGCQGGGGSLCSFDGKKAVNPIVSGNTMTPGSGVAGNIGYGAENVACWAPHPNPPPLVFPPLCVSPHIGGQEPTSIESSNLTNLLEPGDPFGVPNVGVPPSGLLTPEQNAFFVGPSAPSPSINSCHEYSVRQQVGHFLYVVDRARREVVVLNSNRMTVIDRIVLADPTTLAVSPNLDLLAVTNQLTNLVSFIDIDPSSSTFHEIVQETVVGSRPRGIAWQPENEDILVCNEADGTVSIIAAGSLTVRKVLSSQLTQPFDVAITSRQAGFSSQRNVYFAYILDRSGRVAVFESGPSTINGWGYDDIIGLAPETFASPQAIQPDPLDLRSAVWIAHVAPIGGGGVPQGGALSKLALTSFQVGQLPLSGFPSTPQFRLMTVGVVASLGEPLLSGIPIDIAFDDQRNLTGIQNWTTPYSAGAGIPLNGKGLVRSVAGTIVNTSEPRYMFAAIPAAVSGNGVVDVIRVDGALTRVDTNPWQLGSQSIPAPGIRVLAHYFRQ